MRRRLGIWLGAAVCAAVVGTVAAGASVSAAGADQGRTLVVIQSPPQQQYVDLGDPGPSPGDLLVFASTLADWSGNKVGTFTSLARRTSTSARSAWGSSTCPAEV